MGFTNFYHDSCEQIYNRDKLKQETLFFYYIFSKFCNCIEKILSLAFVNINCWQMLFHFPKKMTLSFTRFVLLKVELQYKSNILWKVEYSGIAWNIFQWQNWHASRNTTYVYLWTFKSFSEITDHARLFLCCLKKNRNQLISFSFLKRNHLEKKFSENGLKKGKLSIKRRGKVWHVFTLEINFDEIKLQTY